MLDNVHSESSLPQVSSPDVTSDRGVADVLIARQPILDLDKRLNGYELLFRNSQVCTDVVSDPSEMTRLTMHNALNVVGLEALVGDADVYIHMTPHNMRDQDYLVLPSQRAVLELTLDDVPGDDIVEFCRDASKAGYRLLFNNYDRLGICERVFELADAIKIEIRSVSDDGRDDLLKRMISHGITPIACKVETQDEYRTAVDFGFQRVQGYFFCQPEVLTRRKLVGNQAVCLQFIAELSRAELQMQRIEEIIKSDVALSYGLLKYLNSAALGIEYPIESIRQAMLMLGERPLRKWGAMATLGTMGQNKPHQLLVTGLVRALFCEQVAMNLGRDTESFNLYLVGLLSTIDAILDMPMEQILTAMPLDTDILQTLTGRGKGLLPTVLQLAIASERGAWSTVSDLCIRIDLTQQEIVMLYYKSLDLFNRMI